VQLDVGTVPKTIGVALVLMFLARIGGSQDVPNLPPLKGPIVPTVTFTKSLSGANPSYYSITVSSMGTTSYWAIPNSDPRTGEPEMEDFTVATRTRNEIFQLTEKLHFFRGKFKSKDENGKAGWKSLTFAEGPTQNQIDYTSSKDGRIKRLTMLFESIATTMQYGWKLSRLRAEDPNALAAELKQMQRLEIRRPLAEFGAIAPIVRGIASDPLLPETCRRYAWDMLRETRPSDTESTSAGTLSSGPGFWCHPRAQPGEEHEVTNKAGDHFRS
jgi:hypothetical protein